MRRALVCCNGAEPPAGGRPFDVSVTLAERGIGANRRLTIESPTHALLTAVSGRSADPVRLAAFVHAADQSIKRGGDVDVYGDAWARDLTLCLPVSDPDFWN